MIKIVTDSASDLNEDLVEQYDIEVIPIPVQIGEKDYKDGADITNEEFYQKLKKIDGIPTTSQITPYTFKERFSEMLSEYEEIIYVSFSSQLSGIYNSAKMAKQILGTEKITVIDTKAASLGLGLIVLKAAELAKKGVEKDEIVTAIKDTSQKMKHIFGVGSLEMLKKGGRISGATAYIGNLLNIIPILQVNEKGEIVPLSKARGEKRFFNYMINYLKEHGGNIAKERIGISHADSPDKANKLKDMIEAEFETGEIVITKIGAAVGSHTGSGTLTLFFQSD